MYRNKKNIVGTSGFLNVFGDSDKAKVLDFFIENNVGCYEIKEVSAATNVSEREIEKIIKYFVKLAIVEKHGTQTMDLFLFSTNDLTRHLLILDNTITRINADLVEREIAEQDLNHKIQAENDALQSQYEAEDEARDREDFVREE